MFEFDGLSEFEAQAVLDVLVADDRRGIGSHGVGRPWRYRNGLKTSLRIPNASLKCMHESKNSIVSDAQRGMALVGVLPPCDKSPKKPRAPAALSE
ncbi:MAG: hypothetical protein GF344_03625 [Chitinivibrionales bacterium]|nr:hypothetical protein [Chitinivibrionales bacterium]MBD3356161.1 hypothetical protein [Chitinivibrionales bacterium]